MTAYNSRKIARLSFVAVAMVVRRCGIWAVCGIIAALMTTNLPILGDSSLRY